MREDHDDLVNKFEFPVRAVPRHNSPEEHYERLSKEKKEELALKDAQQRMGGVMKAHDPVNSPSHYTSGGIETIDFIEAKQLNYNRGNAVKYIARAGKKGSASAFSVNYATGQNLTEIQDLEKAVWYLQREIQNLKKA